MKHNMFGKPGIHLIRISRAPGQSLETLGGAVCDCRMAVPACLAQVACVSTLLVEGRPAYLSVLLQAVEVGEEPSGLREIRTKRALIEGESEEAVRGQGAGAR